MTTNKQVPASAICAAGDVENYSSRPCRAKTLPSAPAPSSCNRRRVAYMYGGAASAVLNGCCLLHLQSFCMATTSAHVCLRSVCTHALYGIPLLLLGWSDSYPHHYLLLASAVYE